VPEKKRRKAAAVAGTNPLRLRRVNVGCSTSTSAARTEAQVPHEA
jgi:hypothetical protein